MSERKTLKEWRELRGLTVEELADRTGFRPTDVRRWEELGFDWTPQTQRGEVLDIEVLGQLCYVLGIEPGEVFVAYTPSKPEPGEFVIAPAPDDFDMDLIIQNAKVLNLRMAVPTRWGPVLKDFGGLTAGDVQAVANYREAEADYAFGRAETLMTYMRLLEEHIQATGDEHLTVGEALEREDKELGESLGAIGGELTPEPDEPTEQEDAMEIPEFYPTFHNPDVLKVWDDSSEAWAWQTQVELLDDCRITAASRLYPHVKDWGLAARLMAFAGWGYAEDLEKFFQENRDLIEARMRASE